VQEFEIFVFEISSIIILQCLVKTARNKFINKIDSLLVIVGVLGGGTL
jgi:hypothetical protein